MIASVRSAGIPVRDQQRALYFYTRTLGFELVTDQPMGPEPGAPRWIEVRPKGSSTILVLFTAPGQEHLIGTFSNILFDCDDINATYDELSAKGVEFPTKPKVESWGGWWATFKDSEGNEFGMGQAQ